MGLSVIQIHSISGTLEAKEMIFTFACRVYHFWLLWGVAANLSLAHVCAENRSWAAGIKAVPHTPKNICLCDLYKREKHLQKVAGCYMCCWSRQRETQSCVKWLRLRELNQGLEKALGPVLGSGMWVRHPLGCLMLLAHERMVHGNKKAALGPYEDSCCNLWVRTVCVCVSLQFQKQLDLASAAVTGLCESLLLRCLQSACVWMTHTHWGDLVAAPVSVPGCLERQGTNQTAGSFLRNPGPGILIPEG